MPWQVWEAAALTEYHSTREPQVSTRIYQKGLEAFRGEADYVVHYLNFLLSIDDDKSKSLTFCACISWLYSFAVPDAGALFSEVIKTFPPDQARLIWERWARHQYQYGDLATAQALEKSMAEVYQKYTVHSVIQYLSFADGPTDYPIKRFAQPSSIANTEIPGYEARVITHTPDLDLNLLVSSVFIT